MRALSNLQKWHFLRLHAEGHTDRRIAKRIGISSNAVAKRRKRLGLPANIDKAETSRLIRVAIADHLRRGGISQGQKLAGVKRLDAACAGWYGADSLSQVRILNHLWDNPGLTQNELRDRLGYTRPQSRIGGHSTVLNRLLNKLARHGLVQKKRDGRCYRLYAVKPL